MSDQPALTPQETLLAIARRAQDAAPKPQGSGGVLEQALFEIWQLAGAATAVAEEPAPPKKKNRKTEKLLMCQTCGSLVSTSPFEVAILTFDPISDADWHRLVQVLRRMNELYAKRAFGEPEPRFIVISDHRRVTHLSYKTGSLEEAARFREEARRFFSEVQDAEKQAGAAS